MERKTYWPLKDKQRKMVRKIVKKKLRRHVIETLLPDLSLYI